MPTKNDTLAPRLRLPHVTRQLLRTAALAACALGVGTTTADAAWRVHAAALTGPTSVMDATVLPNGRTVTLVQRHAPTSSLDEVDRLELVEGTRRTVVARTEGNNEFGFGSIGSDRRGRLTVAYSAGYPKYDGMETYVWHAGRSQHMAHGGGGAFDVAPDGSAVIAWIVDHTGGLTVARRTPGAATFGAPVVVEPSTPVFSYDATALPGGGAALAIGDRLLRATGTGPFGPPQQLALPADTLRRAAAPLPPRPGSPFDLRSPELRAVGSDLVYVYGITRPAPAGRVVQAAVWTASAERPSAPLSISSGGRATDTDTIVQDGRAIVAFAERTVPPRPDDALKVVAVDPRGTAQTIGDVPLSGEPSHDDELTDAPTLATDGRGVRAYFHTRHLLRTVGLARATGRTVLRAGKIETIARDARSPRAVDAPSGPLVLWTAWTGRREETARILGARRR